MTTPRAAAAAIAAILSALAAAPASGDSVEIGASKDNTLYQEPDGNLSNGAGDYFFAGRTDQDDGDPTTSLRRGVIAFDVAAGIPAGSTIDAVTLTLHMSRSRAREETVRLHRLTGDWGEGSSDAEGEEGRGADAQTGDATWLHTFFPNQFWHNPGGDYEATESASQVIPRSSGFYTWTDARMVADVQAWLENPAGNFGWILIGNEAGTKTAKRFDTRENPTDSARPVLTVVFTPPADTGACCFPDGTCLVRSSGACDADGGDYRGNGVECDPNPCPQPEGACCFTDGRCRQRTESACANEGGQYEGDFVPCSPDPCGLEAFVDPLPIPPLADPVSGAPGEEAEYEIEILEFEQQLHRDLSPTRLWGFDGRFPGPTILAGADKPVTVTWINDLRDFDTGDRRVDHLLPVDLCPHGADTLPRTVVHLHGGHVAPADDGYPDHTFLPGEQAVYFYPNDQRPGTLWYHDHALGVTRLNVYLGLAGAYVLVDDFELGLGLPAGDFEVPLIIQDRVIDRDTGALVYPAVWQDHFFGDTMLVNGKVWPYLDVDQGKYRFRAVNGCTSRTLTLAFSDGRAFHQIGTDGGLLPQPVEMNEITLTPGERADLVVDFEGDGNGDEILLLNSAPAPYPGPPGVGVLPNVMKFVVGNRDGHTDDLPADLREVVPLQEEDAVLQRDFELKRFDDECTGSVWLINGLGWDDITEFPVLGTTEVWAFVNRSAIAHPMHMHLVMFQVLDRQDFEVIDGEVVPVGERIPPPPGEAGWKDTVSSMPQQITRVIAHFQGWPGLYPYHCHILEHEDHEMMRQFETLAACPADFDGNRDVGFPDLLALLAAWGPCGKPCPEDLDGDEIVGFQDLLALLAAWGPCA